MIGRIWWLDPGKYTRAIVTRGCLWWRKQALVEWRSGQPEFAGQSRVHWKGRGWFYTATGEDCEEKVCTHLNADEDLCYRDEVKRKRDLAWVKPGKLPAARVVSE